MVTLSSDTLYRLRRPALFGLFGLGVFVAALYFSFPSERAKEVAIRTAAARDLDLEIGSASPAFGFGVIFSNILVRTRPTSGKPTRFTIESARLSVSPWSLLSSVKTTTVALQAFGGRIEIRQTGAADKKGPFELHVRARDVKMSELPGVREAINLPLSGTAKIDLDLTSPSGKLAEANGDEPIVVRNDAADWAELSQLEFDNVVISPGPGSPEHDGDFGVSASADLSPRSAAMYIVLSAGS